jgi:hypothetical protein
MKRECVLECVHGRERPLRRQPYLVNGVWRPVRESNPCRRRDREATYCNSTELSGMDSTLPHLKDSRERLLDS